MSSFSKPVVDENEESTPTSYTIPDEFKKVIKDFIGDILNTFPEYTPLVMKWWSLPDVSMITDEEQQKLVLENAETKRNMFIFNHCINLYPERFFDILYKNAEMFSADSTINTEFLPAISFKAIWSENISDGTRDTIWKYLQLIMMSLVGSIQDKSAFGDTAKLFEAINEEDFKDKLEETMNGMQGLFEDLQKKKEGDEESTDSAFPSHDDIHQHISGMLGGKLGDLAKEIAEETADSLNIDMDNVSDTKDIFSNLLKNPNKLMGLVKNVGAKLDGRIKSGEIDEKELFAEASGIMGKMKDMPGMENIQGLLNKMGGLGGLGGLGGMGGLGRNAKLNTGAMQAHMDRETKRSEMRDRMKSKMEKRKIEEEIARQQAILREQQEVNNPTRNMSPEEIMKYIGLEEESTENTPKKSKSGKKKGNKKKKTSA